jgi:tRNA(Ile)-lysidine synthase
LLGNGAEVLHASGVARPAAVVEALVRAGGLLDHADDGPVLLLCSAGRDSHALLDLAVRIRGAYGVRVLHVDHGLRDASTEEAQQISARCAELGVAITIQPAGPPSGGSAAPSAAGVGNVHAWARGERARLAAVERDRVGAAVVVTAHTRTDLVETALGRLATQPGRRALLAMRAVEDGGRLVRPLLGISREETTTYCRERGITYRDDPSNADPKYARARLRYGVLPVLRGLNPRVEEAVVRTLGELADEREVLDALVDAELAGVNPHETPSIAIERLMALPVPLGRLVLRELCERTLGEPCPRAASRLADVVALAPTAERAGVAAVDVGGGARVELRGGRLRCVPSRGVAAPEVE